ncbi:MAG: Diguanylate cyclase protein [Devosia sp.]|nr:Diguanylate cyclase protein [Devosia sp.]
MSPPASAAHRVSFHIVWISVALGSLIAIALVLCASWMAREIDTAALNEQRSAVRTYIEDAGRRVQLDQSTAARRTDGVFYSTHGRFAWVPKGMADWISAEFDHDRVYIFYLDGFVLQASAHGHLTDSEILLTDRQAVASVVNQVRVSLVTPATDQESSAACCFGIRRLEDGSVAIISVRPLNALTSAEDFARNPLLLASVVQFNEHALLAISKTLGLAGLRTTNVIRSAANVALLDDQDRPLAYVQWTLPTPAAKLIRQVALPAIISLIVIGGCIFFLLAWLRRTSVRLEDSQTDASFLAMHDTLTGAANRSLFDQRLREALHYTTLAETKILLISIDLDRFKEVNDTYGHAAGDELLREVGRRLLVELPEEATLARLGGDEFAVVQPGIVSDGHARWICQRLVQALTDPIALPAGPISITVSVGFAVETPSTISAEELARRADVALYSSKTAGRNQYTLYQPAMDADRKERLTLQVELRNALLQEELTLVYQPIFSATSGEIAGAEALLRWNHPVRGFVSPELFVGLAEEIGLINELGMWVLRQACVLAKDINLPWIAVNLSPVQFQRVELADEILQALHNIGYQPDRLELEITEGVLLQDSAQVQMTLTRLRAAGVRISIDDFGAGYASISYLRNYKIDKIKIDRSFIKELNDDPTLVHVVRAMVDMGRAMGLSVTAEGVEEDAQRRQLTAMGCTHLQGYLLSRPISAVALSQLSGEFEDEPPVKLISFGRD